MNHRHFKLNQVKARIEGRKALYKQFQFVPKKKLKYVQVFDHTPEVTTDPEDNLTPDALKERGAIVLSKEEAQKVEEQFDKPNTSLLDKVKAKLDSEELQNSENPLSGMLD